MSPRPAIQTLIEVKFQLWTGLEMSPRTAIQTLIEVKFQLWTGLEMSPRTANVYFLN